MCDWRPIRLVRIVVQVADRRAPKTIAEVAFDALAADLTVPHSRPLVDLDRDDYADVEVGEPMTVPFVRAEPEQKTAPIRRRRRWGAQHVTAAIVTIALGFGVGAGIASLLV